MIHRTGMTIASGMMSIKRTTERCLAAGAGGPGRGRLRFDATGDGYVRRAMYWAAMVWLASTCGWSAWAAGAPQIGRVLGVDEGMLSFCASQDPAAAERLRQKIRKLLEGTSPEQLIELRNSDEYRKAYESVSEFAGKIDSHNVARFCAENAAQRK